MEIQKLFKCTIMRGGTSKAVFFNRADLPKENSIRDKIIMRIFGAPDLREIDGIGGADTLTSKVAIIGPSTRPDCDIDYLFGQVNMAKPMIDWRSNCGNIAAAVGAYAVDEGFVDAVEPVTKLNIHQVNTSQVIGAEIFVRGNRSEVEGDFQIAGVPGTGSKIVLDWADSSGAITGQLLPTGTVTNFLSIEGGGKIEASIVDAAIPVVFIRASAIGLDGNEMPYEIDDNKPLLAKIEKIRSKAAEVLGFCEDWRRATKESPYSPFIAICAPAMKYQNWITGDQIPASSVDLVVRLLFMQQMHKTYPVTGSICTTAAAMIPGTIPNQLSRENIIEKGRIRIGHPAGIIVPEGKIDLNNASYQLKRATVERTARCLMKGYAFIPNHTLN